MGPRTNRITVAARMDRLPLLSSHRKLAFILGIGTFFNFYDVFLGSLLAVVLTPVFHLDAVQAALIISAGFVGMFVGAIILSIIADYTGRRVIYLLNLLLYAFFTLAAAFSPGYLWFICLRFLAGLGLGAEVPLTDTYMSEMLPRYARGRYMAWSYTLGFLGIPIASLIGGFLLPSTLFGLTGWRWLLISSSLGVFTVWFMRRNLPESPRWYEVRNNITRAHSAMNIIEREAMLEHDITDLSVPEATPVVLQKRSTLSEVFRDIYAKRTVMLWIFHIFQTIGYYGFGLLAPIVLAAKGFNIFATPGYTALIFAGYPLGSLLSIPIIERVERKWLVVGSVLAMAPCGLGFAFATSIPMLLIAGFLFTFASSLCSTASHIYQAEIFPTRMRSTAVGVVYSLSRLSGAALPLLVSPALKIFGPIAIFGTIAVILCIVGFDISLFGPTSTGQSLELISY